MTHANANPVRRCVDRTRSFESPVDDVGARLDRLENKVDHVVALLARLAGEHGRVDQADIRLLRAIYDAAEHLPFLAASVIRRADDVPALAAALVGADIVNAHQLGKLLARLASATVDPFRLDRRMIRGRRHWQISSM